MKCDRVIIYSFILLVICTFNPRRQSFIMSILLCKLLYLMPFQRAPDRYDIDFKEHALLLVSALIR